MIEIELFVFIHVLSERTQHGGTNQTKVVFSSYFFSKFFEFWSIILQNETKHHVKFLAKR